MLLFPSLLLLLLLPPTTTCLRASIATGTLTFTSIPSTQTTTTTHIHNAHTTSSFSTFLAASTDTFTNLSVGITVAEGSDTDTLTVKMTGSTDSTGFTIVVQYLRISRLDGFGIVMGMRVNQTAKSVTGNSSVLIGNSTYGNVQAFMFMRGFSSLSTPPNVVIQASTTSLPTLKFLPSFTPTSTDWFQCDILIANTSSLIPKCPNCIINSSTSLTTSFTIPKSTPFLYIFSIHPQTTTSYGTTNYTDNTFTASTGSSFDVAVMTVDWRCLSTFVPVNDLQVLMGWEIAVIIVGGAVVLTLVGLSFWYLSILVKRDELARQAFESGQVGI